MQLLIAIAMDTGGHKLENSIFYVLDIVIGEINDR